MDVTQVLAILYIYIYIQVCVCPPLLDYSYGPTECQGTSVIPTATLEWTPQTRSPEWVPAVQRCLGHSEEVVAAA